MQSLMHSRRRKPSAWKVTLCDSIETPDQICNRVRRRLVAARVQANISWEDLFVECDKDRSGTIDWQEMKTMIRNILKVPPQTVCDYELRVLFDAADEDDSGRLDLAELLKYLQHGKVRKEDEAARQQLHLERVRRNVQLAFSKLTGGEAELRRLFRSWDMDDSNRLSQYEFSCFVRKELSLSRWHVMNADLEEFYRQMDKNGDGIDMEEFLKYIRQANKDRGERRGTAEGVYEPRDSTAAAARRRRKTYREELEGSLSRSDSQPCVRVRDVAFTSIGRERRPASRNALGSGSLWF